MFKSMGTSFNKTKQNLFSKKKKLDKERIIEDDQNATNGETVAGSSAMTQPLGDLAINGNPIRLTGSLIPSNSISVPKWGSTESSRNNTTDKHLNTLTMHKLLTFGWIRSYCMPRHNTKSDHIPTNVLETCFEFIYIERIVFCFIASHSIQAVDIHNVYKTQYQSSPQVNVGYDTNGICIYSGSHIVFPSDITSKHHINTLNRSYHTIFKCGSLNSKTSTAMIIPKQQFRSKYSPSNDNIMAAYEWRLPEMPSDIAAYGNTVSFSSLNGLISIGGTQPDIFLGAGSYSGVFQLKWNDQMTMKEVSWRALRRMNTGRAHASSTFFSSPEGTQQLFVCGGDLNGSVEVYSFDKNQWTDVANTNVSRECAGIYYEAYENVIYLGGGHGAQKKIEWYDITKDEWNIFPDRCCNHDFYPSLFVSCYHYDILYIISPKSNLCEYIDRREGKKWNILYDKEMH
eukprot:403926_1